MADTDRPYPTLKEYPALCHVRGTTVAADTAYSAPRARGGAPVDKARRSAPAAAGRTASAAAGSEGTEDAIDSVVVVVAMSPPRMLRRMSWLFFFRRPPLLLSWRTVVGVVGLSLLLVVRR